MIFLINLKTQIKKFSIKTRIHALPTWSSSSDGHQETQIRPIDQCLWIWERESNYNPLFNALVDWMRHFSRKARGEQIRCLLRPNATLDWLEMVNADEFVLKVFYSLMDLRLQKSELGRFVQKIFFFLSFSNRQTATVKIKQIGTHNVRTR